MWPHRCLPQPGSTSRSWRVERCALPNQGFPTVLLHKRVPGVNQTPGISQAGCLGFLVAISPQQLGTLGPQSTKQPWERVPWKGSRCFLTHLKGSEVPLTSQGRNPHFWFCLRRKQGCWSHQHTYLLPSPEHPCDHPPGFQHGPRWLRQRCTSWDARSRQPKPKEKTQPVC